jgi:ABC-type transport system involved in multi-copper enzyme maturation permease subunit
MITRARRFWHLVQLQLAAAMHERVAWLLAGPAVALAASGAVLRSFNFGAAEPRFFTNLAHTGLLLAGVALAAVLAPTLLAGGGSRRTAAQLFTRRVTRGEWVLANFAVLWLVLGWLILLVTAVLLGLLARHGHAAAWSAAARTLAGSGATVLTVGAGAVLFAAIFDSVPAAAGATLALALTGQLAPVLVRMRESGLAWRLLDLVVPDFATFSAAPGGTVLAYALGYAAAFVAGAVLIFSHREL